MPLLSCCRPVLLLALVGMVHFRLRGNSTIALCEETPCIADGSLGTPPLGDHWRGHWRLHIMADHGTTVMTKCRLEVSVFVEDPQFLAAMEKVLAATRERRASGESRVSKGGPGPGKC